MSQAAPQRPPQTTPTGTSAKKVCWSMMMSFKTGFDDNDVVLLLLV